MTLFNRSTCRRLKSLRQIPSVWEGDRYPLRQANPHLPEEQAHANDCILWVDGSTAHVRAMEMVSPEAGPEAVVRVLLRAMEQPHNSSNYVGPARPKKIVVRNRELQFFLRGILQDLDITVSYSEKLPVIDEILQGLQAFLGEAHPQIPPQYANALQKVATQIWNDAPWEKLAEEKVIAVELNYQEIDTLYVSFLGLLGVEFGVLMYRSQDSLKAFRQRLSLLDDASPDILEEVFLQQDCFFMTFESASNDLQAELAWSSLSKKDITPTDCQPEFGSLHPLEGMRPILYEEETLAILAVLKAVHVFFQQYQSFLHHKDFPLITEKYWIDVPDPAQSSPIAVTVSTMPALAAELESLTDQDSNSHSSSDISIQLFNPDTIPQGTLSQFGQLPWERLAELRATVKVYQPLDGLLPTDAEGFPIVLLQTSRPKALRLIETLQQRGGVESIGFTARDEQSRNSTYELGLLHTHDGVFHIFSEYDKPTYHSARQHWDECCKRTNGHCGLIIAKGVTGAARGNPSIKDMLALFETRSANSQWASMDPL